jgi:hypothetical protein
MDMYARVIIPFFQKKNLCTIIVVLA